MRDSCRKSPYHLNVLKPDRRSFLLQPVFPAITGVRFVPRLSVFAEMSVQLVRGFDQHEQGVHLTKDSDNASGLLPSHAITRAWQSSFVNKRSLQSGAVFATYCRGVLWAG